MYSTEFLKFIDASGFGIRYLSALLSARDAWIVHLNAVYCALLFMGHA